MVSGGSFKTKKHLHLLLFILFSLSFHSFAQADQTFTLDEMNASISFPDGYACSSRYDAEDGAEELFAQNQYMKALSPDLSVEFSLTCLNSSGADYLSRSDQELQSEANSVAAQLEASGINWVGHEVLRTENNAFVVVELTTPLENLTVYQRQYSTLKSNLYTNLTFTSKAPFTDQQSVDMLSIVSSLQWLPASEFTYSEMTLEDAGVSFLRPDQWLHEESIDYPFINNSFVITRPDGEKRIIIIMYGDAAPYLTIATGISDASEMNINAVSKSALARYVIGVNENRLQETEICGVTYYRYRMTKEEDNASSDVMYQYFHLRNGIIYMFQFDAETDDPYYPAFEVLLNSIQYL